MPNGKGKAGKYDYDTLHPLSVTIPNGEGKGISAWHVEKINDNAYQFPMGKVKRKDML